MSTLPSELIDVHDQLKDRVILLTGASGFLGHGLLHRLYETNIKPRKIYLLIRPALALAKVDPTLLHDNLEIISGNPSLPLCGLSRAIYSKLSREVEVVLHLAADTRFLMSIDDAMESNPRMTYNLCEFTVKSPSVRVHIHISTAWLHLLLDGNDILPEAPITPKVVSPNTYILSKQMSESITAACANSLHKTKKKFAIIRTSTIGGAISCPHPGWHGKAFASPVSAVLSATHDLNIPKELLQTQADIIPVDICANQILGLTAHFLSSAAPPSTVTTLNVAAGHSTPSSMTWESACDPVHRTEIGVVPAKSILANYRLFYLRNARFEVSQTRRLLKQVNCEGFPISVSASMRSIGGKEAYLDQQRRALDRWVGKGKKVVSSSRTRIDAEVDGLVVPAKL